MKKSLDNSTFRGLRHRFQPALYGFEWRYNLCLECLFYWRSCRNWRVLIRSRLHNVPVSQLAMRNGLSIMLDEQDPIGVALPMFLEIWRDHCYTQSYKQSEPRVIVDVGAHIGMFALYAASRWPKATVVCIEPNQRNFALLQRNIELNYLPQIQPFAMAVSSHVGEAQLVLATQSDSHSLFAGSEPTRHSGYRCLVPTVTLKEVLALIPGRHVDLLKIDCEGSEFDFFDGQHEILSVAVRYIVCEYHERSGRRFEELVDVFSQSGFQIQVEHSSRPFLGKIRAWNKSKLDERQR